MIPTPEQVLPVLASLAPAVWQGVQSGVERADELLADEEIRDNHFWSHCARYYNRRHLAGLHDTAVNWRLIAGIPNTGIHVTVDGMHTVRVLRSLGGTMPHPGRNRARREAWAQPASQTELHLTSDHRLTVEDNETMPRLSLIIDWHLDKHHEPAIHIGLPVGPWGYNEEVRLHWRVPLPGSEDEFASLGFRNEQPADEFGNLLRIDRSELGRSS